MNKNLGKTLWTIAAAVFISGMFVNSQLQQEDQSNDAPASGSNNSYDLKVEGTGNGPVPLDFDLQGSRNKAESENNLQKTNSADVLQPNAKQRDF